MTLSAGAIAGIVAGVLGFFSLVGGAFILLAHFYHKSFEDGEPPYDPEKAASKEDWTMSRAWHAKRWSGESRNDSVIFDRDVDERKRGHYSSYGPLDLEAARRSAELLARGFGRRSEA